MTGFFVPFRYQEKKGTISVAGLFSARDLVKNNAEVNNHQLI